MRRHRQGALLLTGLLLWLLVPPPGRAEEMRLMSISARGRFSESTVLGDDAPEEFEEFDLAATFSLPWQRYRESGWGVGTRLMASAGILRGGGESALALSLVPLLAFGTRDGRWSADAGIGVALLSEHKFGSQDFGHHLQFALTAGVTVPVYQRLQAGYRFLHYSDAALHGSDTTGVDFHMIELAWRF